MMAKRERRKSCNQKFTYFRPFIRVISGSIWTTTSLTLTFVLKRRILAPRPFEQNCAWAIFHFSNARDEGRCPSRSGIFAWSGILARKKPQPRSQSLSSLPPLFVGKETLVAAGHVTSYPSKTIGWVGTQVHLVETTIKYPTLPADFSTTEVLGGHVTSRNQGLCSND